MPKVSELKTAAQIAAEELRDPEIRREHERTALAHAVAVRVIALRQAAARLRAAWGAHPEPGEDSPPGTALGLSAAADNLAAGCDL
jgi:hypothetical protein